MVSIVQDAQFTPLVRLIHGTANSHRRVTQKRPAGLPFPPCCQSRRPARTRRRQCAGGFDGSSRLALRRTRLSSVSAATGAGGASPITAGCGIGCWFGRRLQPLSMRRLDKNTKRRATPDDCHLAELLGVPPPAAARGDPMLGTIRQGLGSLWSFWSLRLSSDVPFCLGAVGACCGCACSGFCAAAIGGCIGACIGC